MEVNIRIRWGFGQDAWADMEPLVFQLLEAVESGHSLRSAARQCGASYRHAWGMMRHWERVLGAPLLDLVRGRGASLSAVGRCLLWAQRRPMARLEPVLDSLGAQVAQELEMILASATPVRLIASHDLALDLLRDRMNALELPSLNVQYRGSLDAVRQLVAGHCDVAGFHLPEQAVFDAIRQGFARLLPESQFVQVQFVRRRQGLIIPAGNPAGVEGLGDLVARNLRFLNRQPGSGTRLLFDELLSQAGIQPSAIRGYDLEEFTHLAVAAMVASGAADAGFGVQAAAARFGLDFVPLVPERYLLAFRASAHNAPWCRGLIDTLQGDAGLRQAIDALPGYDSAGMGDTAPG